MIFKIHLCKTFKELNKISKKKIQQIITDINLILEFCVYIAYIYRMVQTMCLNSS